MQEDLRYEWQVMKMVFSFLLFFFLNLDLWILILGSYFMKMMDFWLGMEDISQNWEITINPGVY